LKGTEVVRYLGRRTRSKMGRRERLYRRRWIKNKKKKTRPERKINIFSKYNSRESAQIFSDY
jgi:hypothetical protein